MIYWPNFFNGGNYMVENAVKAVRLNYKKKKCKVILIYYMRNRILCRIGGVNKAEFGCGQ